MDNKKEIIEAKQSNSTPVKSEVESLISQAITNNVPVETMERLLAMRRELKAEHAKEAFDRSMAAFQAECPTIQKKKKVSFNTTNYSYAPLEEIVEQVKELLAKNGFSYTFDTKQTENSMIMCCKVKHEMGHSEVSEFKIEIDNSAKMNVSQRYGSASSYGKRYAFCNAFGILTGDEDNDAVSMNTAKVGINRTKDNTNDNGDNFKISEKQINYIRNLLSQKGHSEKHLEIKYEVTDIHQLTKDQASTIIENLLKLDDATIH